MTDIVRIEKFTYRGVEYPTLQKAIDNAENLFFKSLEQDLTKSSHHFSANDCFVIAQKMLLNRKFYAELLDYNLPKGNPE